MASRWRETAAAISGVLLVAALTAEVWLLGWLLVGGWRR